MDAQLAPVPTVLNHPTQYHAIQTVEELTIDRARILDEISTARAERRHGEPIFVGVNNEGLLRSGELRKGQQLLRVFDEGRWKKELSIFQAAGMQVTALQPIHGEFTYVVEIPELGDEALAIRYFGLEMAGGILETPPDPRAPLLPRLLTNTEIARPLIYTFVQIEPLVRHHLMTCAQCLMKASSLLKCPWTETFYCGEVCQEKHWPTHRRKLPREKQTRYPPDLLTPVYLRPDQLVAGMDAATFEAPVDENLQKGFKPEVIYKLGNNTEHVIPAGLYTQSEWFQKTLEAQDLVIKYGRINEERGGSEDGGLPVCVEQMSLESNVTAACKEGAKGPIPPTCDSKSTSAHFAAL